MADHVCTARHHWGNKDSLHTMKGVNLNRTLLDDMASMQCLPLQELMVLLPSQMIWFLPHTIKVHTMASV